MSSERPASCTPYRKPRRGRETRTCLALEVKGQFGLSVDSLLGQPIHRRRRALVDTTPIVMDAEPCASPLVYPMGWNEAMKSSTVLSGERKKATNSHKARPFVTS